MASSETLRAVLDAGAAGRRLDELSSARLILKVAEQVHAAQQKAGAGKSIGPVPPSAISIDAAGDVSLGAPDRRAFSYAAPEQLDGSDGDRRSDVWTLGVVMWEALAGQPLFEGGDDDAIRAAVRLQTIDPPAALNANIPSELSAICMRALSRNPADRYQSAKVMAAEVEAVLDDAGYSGDDKIRELIGNLPKSAAAVGLVAVPARGGDEPLKVPANLPASSTAPGVVIPRGDEAPRNSQQTPIVVPTRSASGTKPPAILDQKPTEPPAAMTAVSAGTLDELEKPMSPTSFLKQPSAGANLAAALANAGTPKPERVGMQTLVHAAVPAPISAPADSKPMAPVLPKAGAAQTIGGFASGAEALKKPLPSVVIDEGAEAQRGVIDQAGSAGRGSAAEAQRGVIDQAGSGDAQRGVVDQAGSAGGPRGVIDQAGSAGRGSAPEGQRGIIDQAGSAGGQRGVIDEKAEAVAAKIDAKLAESDPALDKSIADAATEQAAAAASANAAQAAKSLFPQKLSEAPTVDVKAVAALEPATSKVSTLVDTTPPANVTEAARKPQPTPDPSAVVSLPAMMAGRESQEVLGGWGWGTDSHPAINESDADDDALPVEGNRRTIIYVFGGLLAAAALVVVIAMAMGGSKKEEPQVAMGSGSAANAIQYGSGVEYGSATGDPTGGSALVGSNGSATGDPTGASAVGSDGSAAAAVVATAGSDAGSGMTSATTGSGSVAASGSASASASGSASASASASGSVGESRPAVAGSGSVAVVPPPVEKQVVSSPIEKKASPPPVEKKVAPPPPPVEKKVAPPPPVEKKRTPPPEPKHQAEPKHTAEATPAARADAEAQYKQGIQLFARGDSAGALTSLRAALASNPGYPPTWRGLGLVFEKMGERDQARAAFKRYLQLAPGAGDADQIRNRMERLGS